MNDVMFGCHVVAEDNTRSASSAFVVEYLEARYSNFVDIYVEIIELHGITVPLSHYRHKLDC